MGAGRGAVGTAAALDETRVPSKWRHVHDARPQVVFVSLVVRCLLLAAYYLLRLLRLPCLLLLLRLLPLTRSLYSTHTPTCSTAMLATRLAIPTACPSTNRCAGACRAPLRERACRAAAATRRGGGDDPRGATRAPPPERGRHLLTVLGTYLLCSHGLCSHGLCSHLPCVY